MNILVMTNTFSRLSVAVAMPKQQVKIFAKAVVDKEAYTFYVYGILRRIH